MRPNLTPPRPTVTTQSPTDISYKKLRTCAREYLNKSTAFTPEALIEAKER